MGVLEQLTNAELELLIYEFQEEKRDPRMLKKILEERKRRSLEE